MEKPDLRCEYKLTVEEFMELVIAMYGRIPTEDVETWSQHENSVQRCDEVWKKIANVRDLDWKSILPSERGEEYFTAIRPMEGQ